MRWTPEAFIVRAGRMIAKKTADVTLAHTMSVAI
jgi:hypothetical protein